MNKNFTLKPGEARFDGQSVQDVLIADGDRDRQPDSYKMVSYQFLGNERIPYDRYLSREFYELEITKMWNRTWQWACREEHIAEAGDYYVYDVGRYSLIVTRLEDGSIKAFYNSCMHRGTKLKPSYSEGSGAKFTCPFHGWSWKLNGEIDHQPCSWDFPHITGDAARLPEVHVALWGGFVFINMAENPMPFDDYIGPLRSHTDQAQLQDRYVALHVQKELPVNWKIAQEAFIESYHGMVTHPQTAKSNSVYNSQYDIFGDHLSRMFLNLARADETLKGITQNEMLGDIVLGGDNQFAEKLTVPEGGTARAVMSDYFKKVFSDRVIDCSDRSISEMIDVIGYILFPNGHFYLSPTLGTVHRVRPLGNDPDKSMFELISLMPVPKTGRPLPVEAVRVPYEGSYTDVPVIDQNIAKVYDQDTANMVWQQEGMATSKTGGEELGSYQEVLIRHIHQTIDRYIAS